MPRLTEPSKSLNLPISYQTQKSAFLGCARMAEMCDWVSPSLKYRCEQLQAELESDRNKDPEYLSTFTSKLSAWIRDWTTECTELNKSLRVNINLIIRFYRSNAMKALQTAGDVKMSNALVSADSAALLWQNRLDNLKIDKMTLAEIDYITHFAADIVKGKV